MFCTVFMATLSETRLQVSDEKLLLESNLLGNLVEKKILPNFANAERCSTKLKEVGSILLKSVALQIG